MFTMRNWLSFLLLSVLFQVTFNCVVNSKYLTCCGCKKSKMKYKNGTIEGKKMDCCKINVSDMFAHADFPKDIVLLSMDLSNDDVKEISKATFGKRPDILGVLKQVMKLDLSSNDIRTIAPGSFSIFPQLTRLNLSDNSIGYLSKDMFIGLPELKVLDLSLNIFPIIPGDVFSSLPMLGRLYLRSTDFVCNCLMKDFIEWNKKNLSLIKLVGNCHLPPILRDKPLRGLNPSDLKCDEENMLESLPYFEMIPATAQLVFEGDHLLIQCEGTNLPTSEINWSFNDASVDASDEIILANATVKTYQAVIAGRLKITNLTRNHTGEWSCTVRSQHGSETHMVKINVVSRNASYCDFDKVENDRGEFSWPSTISGITKSLQCPISKYGSYNKKANRSCNDGDWRDGYYTSCPYKDDVTRLISDMVEKKLTSANAVGLIQKLINDLKNKPIVEPLAVEFAGNLMERLKTLMIEYGVTEIGNYIINFASYIMNADIVILREAQILSGACEKIRLAVRSSALDVPDPHGSNLFRGTSNIAVIGYRISKKVFYNGFLCKVLNSNQNLKFQCISQLKFPGMQSMQSFISIPNTLLDSCEESDNDSVGYRLYFLAYRSGNLFQTISDNNSTHLGLNSTSQNLATSTSMVLEVGVSGCSALNFSKPVVYNFETSRSGVYNSVVWSPTQGWKTDDGCSATPHGKNFTRVDCKKLGNVTILYDPNSLTDSPDPWSLSNLAHPVVFAGTGVLIACLITVIMSYVCCYNKLRISSDARHMLINICAHLLLVSCAFAFGIWRVDYRIMCLTCGVVLHYASLAVLLWITISARNIHRELIIHSRPPSVEPKPQRPLRGFYLIGWGIPALISGITAAAKLPNYGVDEGHPRKYCWLSWETSVFAFYLPAALIAVVCVILLIRVLCALNRHSDQSDLTRSPLSRSSWQGNQRIANGEGTPLRYGNQANTNNNALVSSPVFSIPRSNEQSYKTQLCSVALLFIFYLLIWVTAALSVAAPSIEETLSYQEEYFSDFEDYNMYFASSTSGQDSNLSVVFSYVYAILAAIMGVFLVAQHLVCRSDVRSAWCYLCSSCLRMRKGYRRNAAQHSETTSSPQIDGSDNLDIHRWTTGETSTQRENKKLEKEHDIMYTVKTDPVTMETLFRSTDLEDDQLIMHEGIASGQIPMKKCNIASSPIEMCNNYQSHEYPDSRLGRATKSITSMHSGCAMKHSQPAHSSSFMAHSRIIGSSSGNKHIHHPCSHDHFMVVDSRGYIPDPHLYQHHGYHNHHHGHLGHSHGQINKPIKLINLHPAHHDSSMTEHSFDELAHNNMHTIPVVMQHHSQPKVDNTRYQKMRKALERRRAKQKKLNVLREYAQDPLTSNDEGIQEKNSKEVNVNEASPLIHCPEKKVLNYNDNLGQFCTGDLLYPGVIYNQNESNYRTQFISPPSNKRQDTQKPNKPNHTRSNGPTRRVKRLEHGGQNRHGKGVTNNDKNAAQISKRAKQNMRCSQNSTPSERERDTTSSEKSRGRTAFSCNDDSISFGASVTQNNQSNVNPPSAINCTNSTNIGGNDNHGYLTLQQLQSANPFFIHAQNETIIQSHIISSQASPESEKNKNFLSSTEERFSESQTKFNGSSNTVSSRMPPQRNETSV